MSSQRKLWLRSRDGCQDDLELASPRTKDARSTASQDASSSPGRKVLVESIQYNRTPSRFENSWKALKRTRICVSQPDEEEASDTSTTQQLLNTRWPAMKRRAKALPLHQSPYTKFPKSPKVASTTDKLPKKLSSSFKTSQIWTELMNTSLNASLNESYCSDLSEDSFIDSSPITQLVPDQSSSPYIPPSQKKSIPKLQTRILKGGFADEFVQKIKNVRMDQRHMKTMNPIHKVTVVEIAQEHNLLMVLVEPATGMSSGNQNFNIILPSSLAGVAIGSTLKFYLDAKVEPLKLRNNQLVYCQPRNVVVE
ncbi:uncharacterized protein Dana_GF15229 [Drosophila ananassae]|uniref:Uncharacterized protein n=1 Tax=Drosophila ananassae TaxID=7217 RepID=B3MP09_DROAN|nr:uncharacterized protein LOC6498042 [Drosophila ananassae]EDV31175.2 uncharacterized protein Dana_GF15229 [Drosophila ananassae]